MNNKKIHWQGPAFELATELILAAETLTHSIEKV